MANILMIDDDQLLTGVIGRFLSFRGHNVSSANTAFEGLEKVSQEQFDLILLDWQLPDLSSGELIEKMRAACVNTPVIVLTGNRERKVLDEALDAGAVDVMTKPFSNPQLLEQIKLHARQMTE